MIIKESKISLRHVNSKDLKTAKFKPCVEMFFLLKKVPVPGRLFKKRFVVSLL